MARAARSQLLERLQLNFGVRQQQTLRVNLMRLLSVSVGVALAFSGCAAQETQMTTSGMAPSDPMPGWATLAANDSLRTSIDTTRIFSRGQTVRVWIAVKDVTTASKRASESPFLRFETLQEIECAAKRAHGVSIRTPDAAGSFFESPVNDSSWKVFADHGLGPAVVGSVCKYLATSSPRG